MSIFFKKYPYPKRLCYPLVWQLYRTNLCGKVTIPGTLCATNKMTDCWKSHSPVSRGAGYGSERVAGEKQHLSCFSPMNLCKQFAPRLTGIINRYY